MGSDRLIGAKHSDYEDIIRQIKDVISARIVTDETGEITEVHVLAGSSRSPKQVVRDIESAFMAQFGIAVDHKKISVAQMQDEDEPRPTSEVRPKLVSVTVLSGGRTTEARVQLEIAGEIYEGTASGPSTSNNKLRLISHAAVLALESFLKGTCNLVTEDITVITLARRQAIAASISLVTNIGEERLIGAAFLNHDEREAAVKATLAAVNRRMALLLSE
ncbi:MAG: hypothetical protein CVU89_04945 [Firmicutes bacterium HGW-Firmicutes-14]|jgi:hypothetical protein|nr:MAG: hypothetical protein CVU89_04945 [Firmicutes bacterium HGW-Firmicutes-14]